MLFASLKSVILRATSLKTVVAVGLGLTVVPTFCQVTLVVPYAAGGPSDSLARTLVPGLARSLNTIVVVKNVLGNRGVNGALEVANGPRDGSTILYADLAVAGALQSENKGVSLLDSFDAVGVVGERPLVLIASRSGAVDSVEQLKRGGGRIGTAGAGTVSDRCAGTLRRHLGDAVSIQPPYQGVAPLITALEGGAVHVACIDADGTINRTKVLSISRPSAHPALRGIKTFKESGIDLEYRGLVGLFLVKGVPATRVKDWEAALAATLADRQVRARLEQDFFLELD